MARRDARATKERILRAAFREFTNRGFEGARVDEIAARARCNKALLYRHYGDKETLFRHVLECKLAELGPIRTDPERLPQAIGEYFDFHAANRWVSRLAMWEALDFGTKRVPSERDRVRHLAERVQALREAQRIGRVDPSLDPEQTVATLMATVIFWFAAPQIARMISGGDPYTPEALKRRRVHLVDVARRILEVR